MRFVPVEHIEKAIKITLLCCHGEQKIKLPREDKADNAHNSKRPENGFLELNPLNIVMLNGCTTQLLKQSSKSDL